MDLVYFCRDGDNEELRYSIRSAVKNLKFDKLWVVGGKPSWYSGPHIEVPQKGRKYQNVQANAHRIFHSPEISDPFILMNDDFYVVKPVDNVINFNGGRLIDRAMLYDKLAPMSKYTKKLFDTNSFLLKSGIQEPLDFELHVPIVINKLGFKKAFTNSHLWRSMYGNFQHVPSVGMEEDVKVYTDGPLVPKSYHIDNLKYPYLSSDDGSFEFLYDQILRDMFPEPSIYENSDPIPEVRNHKTRSALVTEIGVLMPRSPRVVSKPQRRKIEKPTVAKSKEKARRITPPTLLELATAIKSLENSLSEIRKSEDLLKKELLEIKNSLLELNRLSEDNPRSHL
jgi:hypothetical protein